MIEGWHGEDYLVLFDEPSEAAQITDGYGLIGFIPGHIIVGLKFWDDFILRNAKGQLFTLPAVPMDMQYLKPLPLIIDRSAVRSDDRFKNKIKWFIKPLVFGGNAILENNRTWLSLAQHQDAVKWWNQKYRELKRPV